MTEMIQQETDNNKHKEQKAKKTCVIKSYYIVASRYLLRFWLNFQYADLYIICSMHIFLRAQYKLRRNLQSARSIRVRVTKMIEGTLRLYVTRDNFIYFSFTFFFSCYLRLTHLDSGNNWEYSRINTTKQQQTIQHTHIHTLITIPIQSATAS